MKDEPPGIETVAIDSLRPRGRNARVHSHRQVLQIAESIRRFGFTNPVLISDDREIIAGHGRVMAARHLGLDAVPTLKLSHLSAHERRAYVLADNKLALNSVWDPEILSIEFQSLQEIDFDLSLTGFTPAEIDLTIDLARDASTSAPDAADAIPEPLGQAVTRTGEIWELGRHRLLCGDARSEGDVAKLMGADQARMMFVDPPYNVPIEGNVSGLGAHRHREFAMASGEMTRGEFTEFLSTTLGVAARRCRDGSIAFVCMDWRHQRELLDAGEAVFSELKNLCVWRKANAGMGAFYRSQHELIFVFKIGSRPHLNNFGLGESGRPRTNVWDYPGMTSLSRKRAGELAMHPTVKPTALVADAIKDCSLRGDIMLDVFGGSGTTLIAAESCGRVGRLLECDACYCDTIVRRWETYSGKAARLWPDGRTFEEIARGRGVTPGPPPIEAGLERLRERRARNRGRAQR